MTPPSAQTASAAVVKFLEAQLAEERATKKSLEERALSVITTSGGITTLLLALGALVTDSDTFELPDAARFLLVLALAAFVAAAILALIVNAPATYAEVTTDSLDAIVTPEAMNAPAVEADQQLSAAQVGVIKASRAKNADKANLLRRAVLVEIAGIACVAAAVVIILF
jgi:hypothetical protein